MDRPGPDPGEAAGAAVTAAGDDEGTVQRVLAWLVVVPFTFPMWLSLRRRRPDLAGQIRWALWVNVAQSAVVVVLIPVVWWAIVVLPALLARLLSG